MKIIFISILFLTNVAFCGLNNFMYAQIPIEKYKSQKIMDKQINSFKTDNILSAIGTIYISLERKKIVFKAITITNDKDPLNSKLKIDFDETFILTKIIKLSYNKYVFEGYKDTPYQRIAKGFIEIKKNNQFSAIVTKFEINEYNNDSNEVLNSYKLISNEIAKQIIDKLSIIDFGNKRVAMGDDTVSFE